jgi:hypothetical protein
MKTLKKTNFCNFIIRDKFWELLGENYEHKNYTLPNTPFPNQSDMEISKKANSSNNSITIDFETSSANDFHTLAGQMRKLQLFDYLTLFDFE